MKRKLHIVLALVLVLFGVSSCASYKDISVTSCRLVSINPTGLRSVNAVLELGIHNPIIGFRIDGLSGDIRYKGEPFLLFSADDLIVTGKSDKEYEVGVAGSIVEGFNLLQLLGVAATRDLSQLTLDLSVKVALHNGLGKTLTFKEVPVQSLIGDK